MWCGTICDAPWNEAFQAVNAVAQSFSDAGNNFDDTENTRLGGDNVNM